jgi:hypothetical protein
MIGMLGLAPNSDYFKYLRKVYGDKKDKIIFSLSMSLDDYSQLKNFYEKYEYNVIDTRSKFNLGWFYRPIYYGIDFKADNSMMDYWTIKNGKVDMGSLFKEAIGPNFGRTCFSNFYPKQVIAVKNPEKIKGIFAKNYCPGGTAESCQGAILDLRKIKSITLTLAKDNEDLKPKEVYTMGQLEIVP